MAQLQWKKKMCESFCSLAHVCIAVEQVNLGEHSLGLLGYQSHQLALFDARAANNWHLDGATGGDIGDMHHAVSVNLGPLIIRGLPADLDEMQHSRVGLVDTTNSVDQ